MLKDLMVHTMKSQGKLVRNILCEHFNYTRQELFDLVKINGLKTYEDVLNILGKGDGCELCKWIRQQNEQIPIIMLTTTDSIQDRINGYQAGADAFFILPNEVNELVGKIERTHSHTPCPPKGKT